MYWGSSRVTEPAEAGRGKVKRFWSGLEPGRAEVRRGRRTAAVVGAVVKCMIAEVVLFYLPSARKLLVLGI